MKSLDVIAEEWALCMNCELHKTRRNGAVITGEGPARAEYMLIYDIPSKEDMLMGAPMRSVLDAQYLEILEAGGLPRELIFLTPIVGCTPLVAVGETQTSAAQELARPPSAKEVQSCVRRVHDLIYSVDPKLIFLAGDMSFKALVPGSYRLMETTLAKAAGKVFTAVIPGQGRPLEYAAMALPSPQDVHKNPSAAAHGPIGVLAKGVSNAIKYLNYLETHGKEETGTSTHP